MVYVAYAISSCKDWTDLPSGMKSSGITNLAYNTPLKFGEMLSIDICGMIQFACMMKDLKRMSRF